MSQAPIEGVTHQLIGEEFSWAGECPWTGGLGFGTYSGRLFMPLGVDQEVDLPAPISEEAVNEAAFAGTLLGVSTRCDVSVLELSPTDRRIKRLGAPFDGGAHGIVATAAGGFLAPLGPDGLLFLDADPGPDRRLRTRIGRIDSDALVLYKLRSLCTFGGRGEVFACAARRGGLLVLVLDRDAVRPPIVGYQSPASPWSMSARCGPHAGRWRRRRWAPMGSSC